MAQRWGHMEETMSLSNGTTLSRPSLAAEVSGSEPYTENNERWAISPYAAAEARCGGESRMPARNDFLIIKSEKGNLTLSIGWPTSEYIWTSQIYGSNHGAWLWSRSSSNWLEAQVPVSTNYLTYCKL